VSDILPCAILIPSLNRPQRLAETIKQIHTSTPEEHRILFCVSDDESKEILTQAGEAFIDDSHVEDRRYVTRMNKMIHEIGGAKSVFFGSDDVIHHPGWLRAAMKVMAEGPEVVVVNDLRNRNGTQALVAANYLSRAVFDDPTAAFHPGYHHNFADTEQFLTAQYRGVFARALGSYVEHLHPIFANRNIGWDSTYQVAIDGLDHDRELFAFRSTLLAQHFG
jgi:glycosyltransferase involved in cell wall biosynthesis